MAEDDDSHWVLVFDTETTGVGPDYKTDFNYNAANEIEKHLMRGDGWFEKERLTDTTCQGRILTAIKNGKLGSDFFDYYNKKKAKRNIDLWDESRTYIAQLSYIMYNLRTNEYKIIDKFITDIPSTVVAYLLDRERLPLNEEGELSDEVYQTNPNKYTHPISARTLLKMQVASPENKATILEAIGEFLSDVEKASVVTAHNAAFDRRLVFCELARIQSRHPRMFDMFKANQHKMYCTMCMSSEIAHIDTRVVKGRGERMKYFIKERVDRTTSAGYDLIDIPGIKPPKLWEVYDRLFGYPLIEHLMHDALNDVVACLRVFYRLWMTGNQFSGPINYDICGLGQPDIYGMDVGGEITRIIDEITPSGIDPQGNFDPRKVGLGPCFKEGEKYSRMPDRKVIATWRQKERVDSLRRRILPIVQKEEEQLLALDDQLLQDSSIGDRSSYKRRSPYMKKQTAGKHRIGKKRTAKKMKRTNKRKSYTPLNIIIRTKCGYCSKATLPINKLRRTQSVRLKCSSV